MDYLVYSIEDDKDISLIINKTLSKQGLIVKSFYDGNTFFDEFNKVKPNMILLDMMLPDISGQDILKRVRSDADNDNIDIIIISANHMLMDKIDGLDLGADDYIEKPFELLELMSRVNAKVRRFKRNRILKINDISIDLDKHQCFREGNLIQLTVKEYDILSMLVSKKGTVCSREDILNTIWGTDMIFESRTVDMHIKSIRQKINDVNGSIIQTVYGIGYMVNDK